MMGFILLMAFTFLIAPIFFIWACVWIGGKVGGTVYDLFFRRKDRHEYIMEKFKRCKSSN